MFSFVDKIPELPQGKNTNYSHPYQKPKYSLSGFEIDFKVFPIENNEENKFEEMRHLEEKIAKIKELNELKKVETENKKKFKASIHKIQKGVQNDSENKKEIENINELINNLENIAGDLTRYFFNYRSQKQNLLYSKLNDLIHSDDLKLYGEDEYTRSELISNEFKSLKVNPRKSKRKDPK
ncbi:hypothetical protein M9Y10_008183 [Tritrichomonas musculus]|uniref:Uncharacterized protein n=1 Tax=Tritrichomonas musculus TaxID=1915356 RepID=A0ABR2IXM3_9EUKA